MSEISKRVMSRIPQLKRLREENSHGEAYELAAKLLGNESLEDEFNTINAIHRQDGCTHRIKDRRYKAYQDMLALAKEALSDSDYQIFYLSF